MSVKHMKTRDDGRPGCWICGAPAVQWLDFEHHGDPRFVSTAYCDEHRHEPGPKDRERKIR